MIFQRLKKRFSFTLLIIGVLLFPASDVLSAPGDKENGLKTYKKRCWWCHGEQGMGDGPASKFLSPKPRDFSWGLYKFISSEPGTIAIAKDEDIFRAITNGLPGTGMPSWKEELTEKERWDLVAAVKSFTDLFEFEPPAEPLAMGTLIPYSPESVLLGRKAFEKAKCFECHGEEGRGDGKKRLKDDSGFRIWPRNLHKAWTFRVNNKPEEVFKRISTGLPGTPMPSFLKALSQEERWHVANYVHSLDDKSHTPKLGERIVTAKFLIGALPKNGHDTVWESVSSSFFQLAPNVIAGERFFTPLHDGVKVKAVFNDKEIVFLLEWADRTESVPGNREMEDISDGTMHEDAVAIQFSATPSRMGRKPYIGHGDSNRGSQIWQWKTGKAGGLQSVYQLSGEGTKNLKEATSSKAEINASGIYKDGLWQVMFRRTLKNGAEGDVQFESGEFLPIAFANWDGSNGEVGSWHTFSAWGSLYLEKKRTREIFFASLLTALTVFASQYIIYWGIKQRREEHNNNSNDEIDK